jgi:hypothetical protein
VVVKCQCDIEPFAISAARRRVDRTQVRGAWREGAVATAPDATGRNSDTAAQAAAGVVGAERDDSRQRSRWVRV